MTPRVAVIVPSYNAGELVRAAVASVAEPAPVELVVVDDASPDAASRAVLDELEARGTRVLRLKRNGGPSAARMAGLAATTAPYVFPLDADDLAVPGMLTRAAGRLDAAPDAVACAGDYEEFGTASGLRGTPAVLDPFRVAFNNDYPITALFRRSALAAVGGWRDPLPGQRGYEDWNLWMALAEHGASIVHLGPGVALYRRRLHAPGVNLHAHRRRAELYAALRVAHPRLFAEIPAHRRRSTLPFWQQLVYRFALGDRRWLGRLEALKPLVDRAGLWTARRS
jgi:glycosyltransferase involved in cell wall biosynthesis